MQNTELALGRLANSGLRQTLHASPNAVVPHSARNDCYREERPLLRGEVRSIRRSHQPGLIVGSGGKQRTPAQRPFIASELVPRSRTPLSDASFQRRRAFRVTAPKRCRPSVAGERGGESDASVDGKDGMRPFNGRRLQAHERSVQQQQQQQRAFSLSAVKHGDVNCTCFTGVPEYVRHNPLLSARLSTTLSLSSPRQVRRTWQAGSVLHAARSTSITSAPEGVTQWLARRRALSKRLVATPQARLESGKAPGVLRRHVLCSGALLEQNSERHPQSQTYSRPISSPFTYNAVPSSTKLHDSIHGSRHSHKENVLSDDSSAVSSYQADRHVCLSVCSLVDQLRENRSTLTGKFDWPLGTASTCSFSSYLRKAYMLMGPMWSTERERMVAREFLSAHLPSCEFDSALRCVKARRPVLEKGGKNRVADSITEGDFLFACRNKLMEDMSDLAKAVREALESGCKCLEMDVVRGTMPASVLEKLKM
ncbi:hypothetical protein TraAM80_08960 [Trypanosoma rangeli]|uniref:Uncharacterized protein n=1 Tax=Trypanosoma rangeli TaxID=5698 RepID=A0A422MXY7_TRYRA|nr:uncharacterized protein TraAM80_08960 [Trypanosoma rangeli]RNE98098.1 hypothetical protein TraAM80_08960 [Trypanosoma rangeli]|eukprot:RNE98098.1 hypothetical protein TraAM80_08960 [Trypanosoma rangeli]